MESSLCIAFTYDLYIYDNNGTQFTDTDGNGMVNVDVSRLFNTNDNGVLRYCSFPFSSLAQVPKLQI